MEFEPEHEAVRQQLLAHCGTGGDNLRRLASSASAGADARGQAIAWMAAAAGEAAARVQAGHAKRSEYRTPLDPAEQWCLRTVESRMVVLSEPAGDPTADEAIWQPPVDDESKAGEVDLLGPTEKLEVLASKDWFSHGAAFACPKDLDPYPLTQAAGPWVYLHSRVFPIPATEGVHIARKYGVRTLATLPIWRPAARYDRFTRAHPQLDVFVARHGVDPVTHSALVGCLDRLAAERRDFPVPQYENIIDPNLCVATVPDEWVPKGLRNLFQRPQDGAPSDKEVWCATDFSVNPRPAELPLWALRRGRWAGRMPRDARVVVLGFLGDEGQRAEVRIHCPGGDVDPCREDSGVLHAALERVLEAAAPALARLRRPALLLPGPLQAVVKAQRIFLPPKGTGNASEEKRTEDEEGEGDKQKPDIENEYEGVWHRDGDKHEHIAAVVLYYYRVAGLVGGDLEFADRRPMRNRVCDYDQDLEKLFTEKGVRQLAVEHPRCRVPVADNTLVVFSNHQLVHRVLRMVRAAGSNPGAKATRDFLAFFVVDQRRPLPPTPWYSPPAISERKVVRNKHLRRQLKPSGRFGLHDDLVYITGNGSAAMLGFGEGSESTSVILGDYFGMENLESSPVPLLEKLNELGPVGRGLSWSIE